MSDRKSAPMNEEIASNTPIFHTEIVSDDALAAMIEERVEPVIRNILRAKFHVSLRTDDERQLNQDALDLAAEVKTLIIPELRKSNAAPGETGIKNLEAYVKTVTLNAYHQYLRKKYPFRLRLKNQLRYLLTHHQEFSLWKTDDGFAACGLRQWQNNQVSPAKTELSDELKNVIIKTLEPQNEHNERKNIINLVATLFNHIQKTIFFEDLVTIIGNLQGIKEPSEVEETENLREVAAPNKDIASEIEQKAFFEKMWTEIRQLPLRHRTALLLNLKTPDGENLITLLPLLRVASIRKIAEALEISPEDFAKIWNDLPWDDARIADYLGITRQQVINLRQSARLTLKRKLQGF